MKISWKLFFTALLVVFCEIGMQTGFSVKEGYINLNAGATKNEVLNAIKGHLLAEGELTGRYSR